MRIAGAALCRRTASAGARAAPTSRRSGAHRAAERGKRHFTPQILHQLPWALIRPRGTEPNGPDLIRSCPASSRSLGQRTRAGAASSFPSHNDRATAGAGRGPQSLFRSSASRRGAKNRNSGDAAECADRRCRSRARIISTGWADRHLTTRPQEILSGSRAKRYEPVELQQSFLLPPPAQATEATVTPPRAADRRLRGWLSNDRRLHHFPEDAPGEYPVVDSRTRADLKG